MSKKKIKAEEYMTYDKTETIDLGKAEGIFTTVHVTNKEWNKIQKKLKDAEKNKKALEIIKKKCMFFSLKSDEDNFCPKGHYRVYDNELYQFNELTKEEHELLKEMLDDE